MQQAAAIYGDVSYQAARRDFLRTVNNASYPLAKNPNTWSYLFAEQGVSSAKVGGESFFVCSYLDRADLCVGWLVNHGAEVSFVFGDYAISTTATAEKKQLSLDMMSYWVAFTNSLDPNVKGLTRTFMLSHSTCLLRCLYEVCY